MTTKLIRHNGETYDLDRLARHMDDGHRDVIHIDKAPCDPQEYWDEFVRRYPEEAGQVVAIEGPVPQS